jgi:hypothetical protein
MAEYSYMVLYFPRGTSRDAARRTLTDHAEYGNWELSRLRLYPDGSRKATLRRMIIRQMRAPLPPVATVSTKPGWDCRALYPGGGPPGSRQQSGPPG